jgi:hypothetical protein
LSSRLVVLKVRLPPLKARKASQPGYQGAPCRALAALSLPGRRATWEAVSFRVDDVAGLKA